MPSHVRPTLPVVLLAILPCLACATLFAAAGHGAGETSPPSPNGVDAARETRSQSYVGHANELDSRNLADAYPHLIGTRLDDCQTCHRGGEVAIRDQGAERARHFDHCAFCHLSLATSEIEVVSGGPETWRETLNPYGIAYAEAGRAVAALRAIGAQDSDGDGHANEDEIAALRYPGDPQSRPGQPSVPVRRLSAQDLEALPYYEQLLLLNSHKQKSDSYAIYGGVKILDLLAAVGADLETATGVSFIAPDGFVTEFDLETVRRTFPAGLYFAGLDQGERGFVDYPPPALMPPDLVDGDAIPGAPVIFLAYRHDRTELDRGRLDAETNRLEGEGPLRLIVPQGLLGGPGAPDRGSKHSPSGFDDGYDYDEAKDHNAGFCARGVVAVRVDPLPAGHEDFDWKNGGYALLENRQLIVYGAGIEE